MGAPNLLAAVQFLSRAEAALRRVVSDLGNLGRRFTLVGGLAVSVRTEPRVTRDADLAVLLARADAGALDEARETLMLITKRGYQRGRDLPQALEAAVEEFRA